MHCRPSSSGVTKCATRAADRLPIGQQDGQVTARRWTWRAKDGMRQSLKACRIRGQTDDVAKNEVTLQWAGAMTVAGYATKNPIDRAPTAIKYA